MKKHILFFTLALLLIMPSTLFAVDANAKGKSSAQSEDKAKTDKRLNAFLQGKSSAQSEDKVKDKDKAKIDNKAKDKDKTKADDKSQTWQKLIIKQKVKIEDKAKAKNKAKFYIEFNVGVGIGTPNRTYNMGIGRESSILGADRGTSIRKRKRPNRKKRSIDKDIREKRGIDKGTSSIMDMLHEYPDSHIVKPILGAPTDFPTYPITLFTPGGTDIPDHIDNKLRTIINNYNLENSIHLLLALNLAMGYYINDSFSFGGSLGYRGDRGYSAEDYLALLVNMAYHYNVNDKLNVFISPAIGFDINTKKSTIEHPFSFDTKLSFGAIFKIKNNWYIKTTLSGNIANPVRSNDSKSHLWAQFDEGFGRFF